MRYYIAVLGLIYFSCNQNIVETGLDRIDEYHDLFKDKRLGIITNHTAVDGKGNHISDLFAKYDDVEISAFFGPEHGVRGHAEAGETVASETDPLNNIPIYSLYGKTRKPTPEMLADVDLLVFDIQDIGTRYYTYIYTMALAMEAAAENHVPFVVLDRPNPINGIDIEGNILEPEYSTFVGMFPIPVRHGMTVGELANLFNGEGWLKSGVKVELKIIPVENWHRDKWYDETGLEFIKPSPNMPDLTSAALYPGICLMEGTNLSEGRGTLTPFQIIGAPWLDDQQLTNALNALNFPGVAFRDTIFTPVAIAGAALNPKYKDRACKGVFISITNRKVLKPYKMGIKIIETIYQIYADSLQWRTAHFDRLCGTSKIRLAITGEENVDSYFENWQAKLENFVEIRKSYLLYD